MGELDSKVELIKAISDNLNLGVTIIDKDMKIVWVNKFLQDKGFKLDNVVGTDCFRTFENKNEMCDKCSTLECLKTGKTHKEVRKGADGNDYEVTSIPVKENDEVKYVVEINRNLSQIKVEEQLKESEAKLKEAQKIGKIGRWEFDVLSNKIFWSDETYELYERDKSLGPPSFEEEAKYYPPEESRRLHETAKMVISNGKEIESYDITVNLPSGKTAFFNAAMHPAKDAKGNVIKLFGIVQDITERKKAEQALKESEEKYKKQFEGAIDAFFIADAETGIIIDCNRAACKLVSREKSELVGKHQRILHPPEEIEGEFSRTFKQHLKEKEGQIIETQIITKTGETRDVAIKANILEFKDKKLIQGIFRDITEQKEAERKIRESEEKYRTLVENLPQKIFYKDGNLIYVSCNENYAKDLKIKPNQITGKTDYDFYPKELAEKYRADDKRLMEADKTEEIEEGYTQEGKQLFVHTVKTPVKDKRGNVIGILGIFWDITDRKKAEEGLKELTQQLEQKVQDKTKELKQLYMFSEDIIKNAPIGIYTINKEGIIDLFNPAMVRLAGAESAKQILGSNVFVMESYKKAGLIPYFKQGLEGKPFELDNVEYVSLTSGKYSVRHYMGVPIKNEKGEVERLLLLVEDVTQRKESENKLKKFTEELEQKVEERAKELKARVEELERFNRLAVGRELKMIELKKRIRELEDKLKNR